MAEPEGLCRIKLPSGDCLQPAADDLCEVASEEQAEGDLGSHEFADHHVAGQNDRFSIMRYVITI
ncbi:hypothetical protein [Bosea sp. 2KB_26]|uniref:hypothetical protein n=1 Tax=Bosea sp. 2KB_26 TaxID=3237475 RepID=UPI003F93D764